jgi:hypothetical protein
MKKIVSVFILAVVLILFVPSIQISASSINSPDNSTEWQEDSEKTAFRAEQGDGSRLILIPLIVLAGVAGAILIHYGISEDVSGNDLLAIGCLILILPLIPLVKFLTAVGSEMSPRWGG